MGRRAQIAQYDFWFPGVRVPAGFGQFRTAKQLPVLTMVCGYSRCASAVLVPRRQAEDLFAGWWQLIEELGAVPQALVWDWKGAIGRWRGRRSELTHECQVFPRDGDRLAAPERSQALADCIGPRLARDPHWLALARQLDIAHRAALVPR